MTSTAESMRAYRGPALFSYGFRPFFLAGAGWALLAVAMWLPLLEGRLALPSAFSPIQWHAHELLFGYVPAIVAGFLLTAVPNWTGRLPVVGTRLAALFAIWISGRIAILVSGMIGLAAAAAVDLLFLAALEAVIAREIVASGNLRNLKVLAIVALLFVANALFHLEAAGAISGGYATRLGIGATVTLIMVIGGRIIPSFTRNWLARRGPGRLPAPFDRVDGAIIAMSTIALATWIAAPEARATSLLALIAAALNLWRLHRWAGNRALSEPLVLVLHLAYAFVPIGFASVGLAGLAPRVMTASGALHAWTIGAIGLMTLAVMTRASLGHTGRPLAATLPITAIYAALTCAALARLAVALDVMREPMLVVSAVAWVAAFAGFVIVYAPLLTKPRG